MRKVNLLTDMAYSKTTQTPNMEHVMKVSETDLYIFSGKKFMDGQEDHKDFSLCLALLN